MSVNSLDIAETRSGSACVLALAGRIDSSNAEQFSARVDQLFQAGEKDLVVSHINMNMVGKPATPEALAEFARRRKLYIRQGYIPSLVVGAIALLVFFFAAITSGFSTVWAAIAMGIGVVAFGYNFYARNKWYRCPTCGAPIMSYSEGENLHPDACHKLLHSSYAIK